MCVLFDFTLLPLLGGGRKSWHIIIITFNLFDDIMKFGTGREDDL